MVIFKELIADIKRFSYKYLGKFTKKHSGILYKDKDRFIFFRGGADVSVKVDGNHVVYDKYSDWKMVQTRKGKVKDFERLWQMTKDKQNKAWNFGNLKKGERLLEVGFRDGYNLLYLKKKGVKVEGVEVNAGAVEKAKEKGLSVFEEDIQQKTHFKSKTFDMISAIDILEHCFDPKAALIEMHRILKDGGRVVVEVPQEREFGRNLIEGHSTIFHSAQGFRKVANEAEFEIVNEDLSKLSRSLFLLVKSKKGKRRSKKNNRK